MRKKKVNKYHNHKVEIEGIKFDSQREGERYLVLKKAEREGKITGLSLQVPFELIPKMTEEYEVQLKTKTKIKTRILQLPITYRCDFFYYKDGRMVIEDVKISPKLIPADYKLKEKLFFWRFGIRITRIYDSNAPI